jgi:hypothetical protein
MGNTCNCNCDTAKETHTEIVVITSDKPAQHVTAQLALEEDICSPLSDSKAVKANAMMNIKSNHKFK